MKHLCVWLICLCLTVSSAFASELLPTGEAPDTGPAGGPSDIVEETPPVDMEGEGEAPSVDDGGGQLLPVEGEKVDESVSGGISNTVIILTPEDVATVLQNADDIAVLSNWGSPDTSLLSGSILTYFQGLAAKVGWGEHYVAWRDSSSSRSTCYFAYGDLSLQETDFVGSARVLTYEYISSSAGYRLSWQEDSSFRLNASNGFVYSDLGEYPALNGGETLEKTIVWILGLLVGLRVLGWILFGQYGR